MRSQRSISLVLKNYEKKYGKYLYHQSDRNLPRTNLNTSYTSCTRKSNHEMTGLLLVFLTIFLTNEGDLLDKQMNSDRCCAYIHILELLLMLESLCKQEIINKYDVHWIKDGMSYVMETNQNCHSSTSWFWYENN